MAKNENTLKFGVTPADSDCAKHAAVRGEKAVVLSADGMSAAMPPRLQQIQHDSTGQCQRKKAPTCDCFEPLDSRQGMRTSRVTET